MSFTSFCLKFDPKQKTELFFFYRKMETQQQENIKRKFVEDFKPKSTNDPMSGSIISVTSSLNSPGDSGVQLLDSESEITSVMSNSCDIDTIPILENDEGEKCGKKNDNYDLKEECISNFDLNLKIENIGCDTNVKEEDVRCVLISGENDVKDVIIEDKCDLQLKGVRCGLKLKNEDIKCDLNQKKGDNIYSLIPGEGNIKKCDVRCDLKGDDLKSKDRNVMTKSDIENRNTQLEAVTFSSSAPDNFTLDKSLLKTFNIDIKQENTTGNGEIIAEEKAYEKNEEKENGEDQKEVDIDCKVERNNSCEKQKNNEKRLEIKDESQETNKNQNFVDKNEEKTNEERRKLADKKQINVIEIKNGTDKFEQANINEKTKIKEVNKNEESNEFKESSKKKVNYNKENKKGSDVNKELNENEAENKNQIKNKQDNDPDIMNISLNSYELLDYTLQNAMSSPHQETDQMHVSLSEEVNENLKIALTNPDLETVQEITKVIEEIPVEKEPQEDQIVFRRQRKKKNKSDTPKKRVSFHEDILNSTKIDDIHINHGFITHEPEVSLSFFQRGFIKKPDVVKGRYSWAAEGDAPYYEDTKPYREVKSDIYVHTARYSSNSSSSSASISSSIDEEDDKTPEETTLKALPLLGQPKSSCLKKPKHKKKIDTNIVEESVNLRKKKSESNLLDSNLFGSLKNILNFSTSVPLAERGVPEGQEDVGFYSSSIDLNYSNRRPSSSNLIPKLIETYKGQPIEGKVCDAILFDKKNFEKTCIEGKTLRDANLDIKCQGNVYQGSLGQVNTCQGQENIYKGNFGLGNLVHRNIYQENPLEENSCQRNLHQANLHHETLPETNFCQENSAESNLHQVNLYKTNILQNNRNQINVHPNIQPNVLQVNKHQINVTQVNTHKANILQGNAHQVYLHEANLQQEYLHDANLYKYNKREPNSYQKNLNEEKPLVLKQLAPIEVAKSNLKLTKSEGFYPNYPINQGLPSNIILCDSNVYEHKGISYSYEYDNFKKNFEQEKPKSSTLYQKILKEFNFFKRKAKEHNTNEEDFEFINSSPEKSADEKDEVFESKSSQSSKNQSLQSSPGENCKIFQNQSSEINQTQIPHNQTSHYSETATSQTLFLYPQLQSLQQQNLQPQPFQLQNDQGQPQSLQKNQYQLNTIFQSQTFLNNTLSTSKPSSTSGKMDWSDTETISDLTDISTSTRHLNSPKRHASKPNHYTVQNFKPEYDLRPKAEDIKSELESSKGAFLRPSSSKSSLINRFLRNVTMKKMLDIKLQRKLKNSKKLIDPYLKGVKLERDVNKTLDKEIEEEIQKGREAKQNTNAQGKSNKEFKYLEGLKNEMLLSRNLGRLRNDILRNKSEKIIKIFPVFSAYTTSGESRPLFLIIADSTLYIASYNMTNSYCNHFVLPYMELNTVIIGPNSQTIHISNYDNDMQFIFSTGSANLTRELMSNLELAIRKDRNKPQLPAVKQLNMRDMVNLRKAICKQTSVSKVS